MVLFVVATFVVNSPDGSGAVSQNALQISSNAVAENPLDQLSSADIAVQVAQLAQLEETVAVRNNADSANSQLALAPSAETVVAKPQVVATSLKSRKDIQTYTVQNGDTVSSIATKFGVTSDSVRWSNDISGEAIAAGRDITVPPVNGIVYTVKTGDTPDSLAQRYRANSELIIAFNDAEIAGLPVGQKIVIPDGIQPAATSRRSSGGSSSATGFAWGTGPVYTSNGYDYGWCTWHAANRRRETGNPIPSNLGNAITWYRIARNNGLPTGDEPRAGAVLWHANLGGLGHVAYVEKMNDDGSMLVSDMNYPSWGRVTYRTVPSSEFGNYKFIY